MGCCGSNHFAAPATQMRPGTTLCEFQIDSLDNAMLVTGQKPGGLTPLVLRLPQPSCCLCCSDTAACCSDCVMMQRIPTGFFPIITRFGQEIGDAANLEDDDDAAAGTMWSCCFTRVAKLITKQKIPYSMPVRSCKTLDNVTVSIGVMLVFQIIDGRAFICGLGPEKLDLYLRSSLDESVRALAVRLNVTELYDLRGGSDADGVMDKLNTALKEVGVKIVSFTVPIVTLPPDLEVAMQATTGFQSQKRHLEAEEQIEMLGMKNYNEGKKLEEEAKMEQMQIVAEGQNALAKLDIEITDIKSKASKECANIRAEHEEAAQSMINNANLEVQGLNNDRDSISREVTAVLENEKNEILAIAYTYARGQEFKKAIQDAENRAKAKQVVANVEAESAEVVSARREHEQGMERLKVFEALSRNKYLRIASSEEVEACPNVSLSVDEVDEIVNMSVGAAKRMLH